MKEQFKTLFKEMMADIERCLELELPQEERVECCYRVAQNYWELVKKIVRQDFFQSEADEIDFFRNVKPLFTGYVEFFLILYEAVLFMDENPGKQICYWEEESQRYKRFCDKNEEFVKYYESGCNNLDSIYFLRSNNKEQSAATPRQYDLEPEFRTSHDNLIALLLANKMHFEFANKRIGELKKQVSRV